MDDEYDYDYDYSYGTGAGDEEYDPNNYGYDYTAGLDDISASNNYGSGGIPQTSGGDYAFDDAMQGTGNNGGGFSGDSSNYDSAFDDWQRTGNTYTNVGPGQGNMGAFELPQAQQNGSGLPFGIKGDQVGSLLKNLFAPNSQSRQTGNPQLDSILQYLQAAGGAAKTGLNFAAADQEREKAERYRKYVQDMTGQITNSGVLDPAAKYRDEAGAAWRENNPTLQTLLSGGITANMLQEMNAGKYAAQRTGGRSGQRFAAFADRAMPNLMATARNNDFKMLQEANKQRWTELSTRGDTASMYDLAKLNANAYRDSLTNPMYAAGGKALQDFLGSNNSVSDEKLQELIDAVNRGRRSA